MLTKVNENELRPYSNFLVLNGVKTNIDITPNPVEYLLLKEYDIKDNDDEPERSWDWLTYRYPNPMESQYTMIENGIYRMADGTIHSIRTNILDYLGALMNINSGEAPYEDKVLNPGTSHIICYKNNKYSKDMTVFSFCTLIFSQDEVAGGECNVDPEDLKAVMYQFGFDDDDMIRILEEDGVYESE